MKKSIQEHIDFIKNNLQKENANQDWSALSDFNRAQIGFFQHERLIHLLITLFWGLLFLSFIIIELLLNGDSNLLIFNISLSVITILILVVLVFYIFHYFFLENSVQKLYELDKEITKRCFSNLNLK